MSEANSPEEPMTKYNLEIPDDLWKSWKLGVPRSYSVLGERVNELLAADALTREEYGMGLIEYLDQNDILDQDDVVEKTQ